MRSGAIAVGGALLLHAGQAQAEDDKPTGAGAGTGDWLPVTVPSGGKAQGRILNGARVFHLRAHEHDHAFAPGLTGRCWGYNGHVNGPVIEALEGERVRIYVTNDLPAPTTVHWHGLILPNGMDGVSGLTQAPIPPGDTWLYEFDLIQHGTYMFHSHHDTMTQEGLGLTGMFIIHPREPYAPVVDRDFALLLHEYHIPAGASRPDPNEMTDFNVLTINGKVFPYVEPLVVRTGQRVRMRIGNLSAMDHHPMHVHGVEFRVTAMDGQRVPESQQRKQVTTLVAVGQTRDIEFVPTVPGDWIFHCHMTHHVMNQMGHDFPNMVGVDPDVIDRAMRPLLPGYMTMGAKGMGGMHHGSMPMPENSIPMAKAMGPFGVPVGLGGMGGVLKVRDQISDEALAANRDPGWYAPPDKERARKATAEELRRDGIA
jgi:FtsP/CotA-like multicopper oxidase with cupredoxin domain